MLTKYDIVLWIAIPKSSLHSAIMGISIWIIKIIFTQCTKRSPQSLHNYLVRLGQLVTEKPMPTSKKVTQNETKMENINTWISHLIGQTVCVHCVIILLVGPRQLLYIMCEHHSLITHILIALAIISLENLPILIEMLSIIVHFLK